MKRILTYAQTLAVKDDTYFHFGAWIRWKRGDRTQRGFADGLTDRYVSKLEGMKSPPPKMSDRLRKALAAATKTPEVEILSRWKEESVPAEFRNQKSAATPAAGGPNPAIHEKLDAVAQAMGLSPRTSQEILDKIKRGEAMEAFDQFLGAAAQSDPAKAAISRTKAKKRGEQ